MIIPPLHIQAAQLEASPFFSQKFPFFEKWTFAGLEKTEEKLWHQKQHHIVEK